jgi:hypothetical protein
MNSSLLIIKSSKSIKIEGHETFTCWSQRQNSRYKSELKYRNFRAEYKSFMSDEDHKECTSKSVLIKWSLIIIVFVTFFSDSFCININLKVLAQVESCAAATTCR